MCKIKGGREMNIEIFYESHWRVHSSASTAEDRAAADKRREGVAENLQLALQPLAALPHAAVPNATNSIPR